MYLYKYLFKGPNQASYSVTPQNEESESDENQPIDENKDFIRAPVPQRLRSAWRILRYDTMGKSTSVQALVVHIPGENKTTR